MGERARNARHAQNEPAESRCSRMVAILCPDPLKTPMDRKRNSARQGGVTRAPSDHPALLLSFNSITSYLKGEQKAQTTAPI